MFKSINTFLKSTWGHEKLSQHNLEIFNKFRQILGYRAVLSLRSAPRSCRRVLPINNDAWRWIWFRYCTISSHQIGSTADLARLNHSIAHTQLSRWLIVWASNTFSIFSFFRVRIEHKLLRPDWILKISSCLCCAAIVVRVWERMDVIDKSGGWEKWFQSHSSHFNMLRESEKNFLEIEVRKNLMREKMKKDN